MKGTPTSELRRLVDGMLDGTLEPGEVSELETLLRDDEAAMDYYLDLAGQDGLLKSAFAGGGEQGTARRTLLRKAVPALAAAAAIVLAALWWWQPTDEPVAGDAARDLARVTNLVGVVWKSSETLTGAEIDRGAGPLEIESGLLEITHRSGTRLLVEGPAAYEVTGPNAGRFVHGKLVAEVPPGAEGFTVDCPDGQVVDFGTEFALQADAGGGLMEVGVFRGEVKVRPGAEGGKADAVPLYTGHAVRVPGRVESPLRSIPFDRERFIRRAPSREMPWYYEGSNTPMEWNVSHLIWSAGEHLAVLKWMSGPDALVLSRMELLLDGEVVAVDAHPCSVGTLSSTVDNVYRLEVPDGAWRRGRWVLRGWPSGMPEGGHSEGTLMMEDGGVTTADREDFAGVWEYVHDGVVYRRTFHENGTCLLEFNGQPTPYFEPARWEVRNGILEVRFEASEIVERHLLRDRDSLLFINQPYRNARRVK